MSIAVVRKKRRMSLADALPRLKALAEAAGEVEEKATADGCTPHETCLRVLHELGAAAAFHFAASSGHETCLRALHERAAASLSEANAQGLTPAHFAARFGHESCLRALHELGASLSAVDADGWTPAHFAASAGHADCLRALHELGASLSAVDADGWTPANFAASAGHADCLRALHELGAAASLSEAGAEERQCNICYDAPRSVRFACGHALYCEACAPRVLERDSNCPACRQPALPIAATGRLVAAQATFVRCARLAPIAATGSPPSPTDRRNWLARLAPIAHRPPPWRPRAELAARCARVAELEGRGGVAGGCLGAPPRSLREAVTLPPGESLNEWLAWKTLDLFDETNLVYGFVSEFCTQSSCPIMCAALPNGSICHYAWADERITQPVQLSACDYVSHLFGWVQRQLDSEDIFPTEPSRPFPADFRSIVSKIFRRLFRVYAHAYHNHYERMVALSFLPHINTCFKHFMYFVLEFDLIPRKEELAPLQQLVDKLLSADERKRS